MKIKALVKLAPIDQHVKKIYQIQKDDIFILNGVGFEKNMILFKEGIKDSISIDMGYFQFFKTIDN